MSQGEPQYSIVLVDLDCLLDTRLGTLYCLDPAVATRALNSYYFTRERDAFEHIDAETFRSYYNRRNKLVLEYSPVTGMVDFLQEFVLNTYKNSMNSPYKMIPKIIINTYPYDLTDEEMDQIAQTFVYLTREECDIEVICQNPINFTPARIKKNFSILIMYDYTEWLEAHSKSEAFKNTPCPEVNLLVPSIYFVEPKQNDIDDLKKYNLTLFSGLEFISGPVIGIRVLKTSVFSSAIKPEVVEMAMNVEKIAKAAHEAIRIYSLSTGSDGTLHWDEIPEEVREGTRNGVEFYLNNPGMDAAGSHAAWRKQMEDDGWTYGEEKDFQLKTHPSMVDFEELPADERYKDLMFQAVVDALRDEEPTPAEVEGATSPDVPPETPEE